jgi:hypothetical protein
MKTASTAASVLLLAVSAGVALPAHAQLRVSIGTEYFSWKEDVTPAVKETGALLSAGAEYTMPRDAGFLLAYRGRLYGGEVSYTGATLFPPNTPIESQTRYLGASNEGQVRYRFDMRGSRALDLVLGMGVDVWQRTLSRSQKEDFVIGFARLGVETEAKGTGWLAGVGVKMPFYTWENAHLTDIGFTSNPILKPGKRPSPYLHVGYRFQDPIAVVLYVDSFRFSQSPYESVTHSTQGPLLIYQPASDRYSVGVKVVIDLF